jgi:hypothetical protein
MVVISDSCEERPDDLYTAARKLGCPAFMFQEGDIDGVTQIYTRIAEITGGAFGKFDPSAPQRLGDLLKAVAAFAAGGIKALADQRTEAARLLISQIKH